MNAEGYMPGLFIGWQNCKEYASQRLLDHLRESVEQEPHICAVFGCGRTLSLQEQLFGNTCINHNPREGSIQLNVPGS